jgi:hypothetical protein
VPQYYPQLHLYQINAMVPLSFFEIPYNISIVDKRALPGWPSPFEKVGV